MAEAEWLNATDARRLVGLSSGKVSGRKLRLFMIAWCRYNWERITLPVVKDAVELAERFADGRANKRQLEDSFDEYRPLLRGGSLGFLLGFLLWPDSNQMCDCADRFCLNDSGLSPLRTDDQGTTWKAWQQVKAEVFRDIAGNPFRPVAFDPAWRTETAVSLARGMYESRDFGAMPILADALQDAGCDNGDVLNHCRADAVHVRGCWIVDLLLGKM